MLHTYVLNISLIVMLVSAVAYSGYPPHGYPSGHPVAPHDIAYANEPASPYYEPYHPPARAHHEYPRGEGISPYAVAGYPTGTVPEVAPERTGYDPRGLAEGYSHRVTRGVRPLPERPAPRGPGVSPYWLASQQQEEETMHEHHKHEKPEHHK